MRDTGSYGVELSARQVAGLDDGEVRTLAGSMLARVMDACAAAPDWATLTVERRGNGATAWMMPA